MVTRTVIMPGYGGRRGGEECKKGGGENSKGFHDRS